jgi:hypothetical protein
MNRGHLVIEAHLIDEVLNFTATVHLWPFLRSSFPKHTTDHFLIQYLKFSVKEQNLLLRLEMSEQKLQEEASSTLSNSSSSCNIGILTWSGAILFPSRQKQR